jgi:hypothetical protein
VQPTFGLAGLPQVRVASCWPAPTSRLQVVRGRRRVLLDGSWMRARRVTANFGIPAPAWPSPRDSLLLIRQLMSPVSFRFAVATPSGGRSGLLDCPNRTSLHRILPGRARQAAAALLVIVMEGRYNAGTLASPHSDGDVHHHQPSQTPERGSRLAGGWWWWCGGGVLSRSATCGWMPEETVLRQQDE